MEITTTRFGKINVDEESIITFSEGMLGFSKYKTYAVLDDELGEPFQWMQSIDEPSLAFVVIEPSKLLNDYHFSLRKEQVKGIDATSVEDLDVLVIVSMANSIVDVTVNLQGPIVINRTNRKAHQVVLNNPEFSTRYQLFSDVPDDQEGWCEAVEKENQVASVRIAAS